MKNHATLHPHGGQPVAVAGRPLHAARGAMIFVHGRGATAASILTLAHELAHPDFAYLAPQAAGQTWYPQSFLAPIEQNEPGRTSGLEVLDSLVTELERHELTADRVFLVGFSQGACLTVEYAARYPRRYAGVAAFTGGLIGPLGHIVGYDGSLAGTPVFLGAGDPDPHVPWAHVAESAEVLGGMGAEVTLRRYPGLPHTIYEDELDWVRQLVGAVAAQLDSELVPG